MDDIQPKKERMAAIIPCAGYGTRMGMKPNKSKELLINPETNEPLIKWHIDLCKEYNLEPIFIVRPEKKDLIKYLKGHRIIKYTPVQNEEWMYTVYNNRQHFSTKNILLLPDTCFSPRNAIVELKNHLEWLEWVLLTHEVPQNQSSLWGIYQDECILEKPKDATSTKAWGVIAFDISCVNGFKELGETKKIDLRKRVKHDILLNEFKDITRGDK